MPRKREVVWDPSLFPQLFEERHTDRDRQKSPLAALMEAAPNHEPEPTQEEMLPLREAIQDAMDEVLDERERFVFDALVVEKRSIRSVGRLLSLSKTQVARIRDDSAGKLAAVLADHPLVKGHLR